MYVFNIVLYLYMYLYYKETSILMCQDYVTTFEPIFDIFPMYNTKYWCLFLLAFIPIVKYLNWTQSYQQVISHIIKKYIPFKNKCLRLHFLRELANLYLMLCPTDYFFILPRHGTHFMSFMGNLLFFLKISLPF